MPIPPPDWEALIAQIAKEIVEERSPARIMQVRAKLYDLLTHCIPPTTIIKTLTWKLIPLCDDELKSDVVKWSAYYEHRIKMGSVSITPAGMRAALIPRVEGHFPSRGVCGQVHASV